MSMNRFCTLSTRCQSDVREGRARNSLSMILGRSLKPIRFSLAVLFSFALLLVDVSASAQQGSRTKAEDAKNDPDRLPPGYQAPPERLSIMDLDQPIADKEEMARLKKEASKFYKTKTDCDVSPAGQKVVEATIRYRLAEMTLKEKQSELPSIHKRFIDEISNVGGPGRRPNEIADMTQLIGKEVLKQIPELLKNNFYVRLHAVYILGEMDYAPGYSLLLQVLQAKDIREDGNVGQPDALKVAAAMGLVRILRFANPNAKERTAIANAVVFELKKTTIYWWLQIRLIEALRYCDIVGTDPGDNDRPFVVETLLSLVKDSERDWRVRTRACYALGRVPLPKSVKPDDVVNAIAKCALELSNAAAANPSNPHWKYCFWNVYLAFHTSDTSKEKDLDVEKKPGGLLTRTKAVAQPAYQVIVPIVNDVLNGKAPDAGSLKNLNDFVKK